MPSLASIDVGSNAFRLAIASTNSEEDLTILENIREPVRLGQDVFRNGVISEETLDRATETFQKFREMIERHGVKLTRAVATSATREAFNRDLFIDRVMQVSGIDIEVISGVEEARLIHLGVSRKLNLKGKLAMLIDIGGGSVEITLAEGDTVIATESYRMGAVRLLQALEEKRYGEKKFNQLVREYVEASNKRIKKEIGSRKIEICAGTGGNIESLGVLRREVLGKDRESVLTQDELDSLVRKLQSLSFEERIQQLRLRPDRADVIVPAAMVLQKIVKQAGVEEIQIPNVGLKDGVLYDMMLELFGKSKHINARQVMASALEIGRKYSFDEQHGQTVADLAGRIFDETKMLHNLEMEHRLELEVAALLHDIGTFVNITGHHKHTQYLLLSSPIVGLSHDQMSVVANVARYHRKSHPKPQHEPFRTLSPKTRVVVTKLAALLRIADALDNEHGGRVKGVEIEYKKPKLLLRLRGEGDLLLEKWALARKADLFEEVFNTRIVVED